MTDTYHNLKGSVIKRKLFLYSLPLSYTITNLLLNLPHILYRPLFNSLVLSSSNELLIIRCFDFVGFST